MKNIYKKIVEYLDKEYNPLAILIYGSYSDNTFTEFSDFDCMVITEQKSIEHDDSIIDGIQLDCYIYTKEEIEVLDTETFITVFDATIVLDSGIGIELKNRVRKYVSFNTIVDDEEKQFIVSWIKKSINRLKIEDDEGYFRSIELLKESLNDYFVLRDLFYFGSKKSISYLKSNDSIGYQLFHEAIMNKDISSIIKWAEYVIKIDI